MLLTVSLLILNHLVMAEVSPEKLRNIQRLQDSAQNMSTYALPLIMNPRIPMKLKYEILENITHEEAKVLEYIYITFCGTKQLHDRLITNIGLVLNDVYKLFNVRHLLIDNKTWRIRRILKKVIVIRENLLRKKLLTIKESNSFYHHDYLCEVLFVNV
uniref:Uncharacterized protein n=1 Tax=Clastoptera arizonana TaxID=38151 RepID=A0A1B6CV88_9HEMI